MAFLLVDTPLGTQELLEVGDGGSYFAAHRVLWDDRVDGELPAITLGGMVRNGAALVFDQTRLDQHSNAVLGAARAAAWTQIKDERDRRASLGVKVGAHWFHSDPKSRIQQLGLVLLGQGLPAVQWKTLTFTPPPVFVPMTPALAVGIMVATAQSDTAIFAAAEAHRQAMEASATPQDYDFSANWPTSIEDEANAAGIEFNSAVTE